MTTTHAYWLITIVWGAGFVLAAGSSLVYWWRWRQLRAFNYYLHHGMAPAEAPIASITGGWVRDAVFHLGLRVLLAVFAVERLALQASLPPPADGAEAFAISPFQLALALTYFLILLWSLRWTWLTQTARVTRRRHKLRT